MGETQIELMIAIKRAFDSQEHHESREDIRSALIGITLKMQIDRV